MNVALNDATTADKSKKIIAVAVLAAGVLAIVLVAQTFRCERDENGNCKQ
jgi:hypothetical protein